MRRTLSVCSALGLLVALPAPASAKKPIAATGSGAGYRLCVRTALEDLEIWQIDYVDDDFEPRLDADHPAA